MSRDLLVIDSKGRITLPKEIRQQLNLQPGDRLYLTILGNRVILEKMEDPFETLKTLLKDFHFEVTKRKIAEEMALKEVIKRDGKLPSGNGFLVRLESE